VNNTRIVVLAVILIVCLALMGWTVYQKQVTASRPIAPPIGINLSPEALKPNMTPVTLDSMPATTPELPAGNTTQNAFIFTNQSKGLGRVDPFLRLSAEYEAAGPGSTPLTINQPVEPVVRGIIMSNNPIAYIEDGSGPYRKVRIGDFLAGGRIIAITERSVVLIRNGIRVILRLGE
jgi:hypothetical protein